MPKSKSSKQWLARHQADPFVKQANAQGLRARSVFKLAEIADKYQLLSAKMTVIDLGAAPGGWSQYVAQQLDRQVIAVDRLAMEPLLGVHIIQGDFTEQTVCDAIMAALADQAVDLVLSDMAPNMSGHRGVDQPRAMYLAELALEFARNTLKPGGACLIKCFQGSGLDAFVQECRRDFKRVIYCKPTASRQASREIYILARDYQHK